MTAIHTAAADLSEIAHASVAHLLMVDFDDTLVRTTGFVANEEQLPSECIPEIADFVRSHKSKGYFVFVLTGRPTSQQAQLAEMLRSCGVPFDRITCRDAEDPRTVPNYKADAIAALATDLRCSDVTLLDDQPPFLNAMLFALRKVDVVKRVDAFLAKDGQMSPYSGESVSSRQAVVVMCVALLLGEDKTLLRRVASHFGSAVVDVDEIRGEYADDEAASGHTTVRLAGSRISEALSTGGQRAIFVLTTGYPKKVKELCEYVPEFATVVLLQPLVRHEIGACWATLKKSSEQGERDYAARRRQPDEKVPFLQEGLFADPGDRTVFNAEEHANINAVWRRIETVWSRCLALDAKLNLQHPVRKISLSSFCPPCAVEPNLLPRELDKVVAQLLRKGHLDRQDGANRRSFAAFQDMRQGRELFADRMFYRDEDAAFAEMVEQLEKLRTSSGLW